MIKCVGGIFNSRLYRLGGLLPVLFCIRVNRKTKIVMDMVLSRINIGFRGLSDGLGNGVEDGGHYDVVIVGSGIAGLRTAVELLEKREMNLAVITKRGLGESNTKYAQGGVAAAMSEKDSKLSHYRDTMISGDGLCNPHAVRVLVDEIPERIKELVAWGCRFNRNKRGGFDLGLEGAHSFNRIVHYKDSTGDEIQRCLLNKIGGKGYTLFENCFCVELLVDNGVCYGVVVFDKNNGGLFCLKSRLGIVLSTGGCGQIYSKTTNPRCATGDGVAMAYRSGAELVDLEFVQFHPTALNRNVLGEDRFFLISESLRGEGAVLVNSHGEQFMEKYSKLGGMDSRDIVSRGVWSEFSAGRDVFLDATHINGTHLMARFPSIYKTCLEMGWDITKDVAPITPVAHYMMGGVKTDLWGRTSIRGLYAVGEVASMGLHGGNRLASNSLADALVFGKRVGGIIKKTKKKNNTHINNFLKKRWGNNSGGCTSDISRRELIMIKKRIQDICWLNLGVVKSGKTIKYTISELERLKNTVSRRWLEDALYFEVINILMFSLLLAHAALLRRESRGAHYRSDYPLKERFWSRRHIVVRRK